MNKSLTKINCFSNFINILVNLKLNRYRLKYDKKYEFDVYRITIMKFLKPKKSTKKEYLYREYLVELLEAIKNDDKFDKYFK